jgi:hypothetical protein
LKRFDKIFFALILGSTPPVFSGMVLIVLWFYCDTREDNVLIYLIIGLLTGITINVIFLKSWIGRLYALNERFIILIYIFINICIYGLFMGFPVFNLISGIIAGYYFGRKICFSETPLAMRPAIIKRVSFFSGLIMTLICISSGFISLIGPGVGKDVQSMLGLDFEVTKKMILMIALVGGLILITAQYNLTKITMTKTIKFTQT